MFFWRIWNNYISFILCFTAGVSLYCFRLPRRGRFPLRLVLCYAVWIGVSIGMNAAVDAVGGNFRLLVNYGKFVVQYLVVFASLLVCFDCRTIAALFCTTNGYCIQHIAHRMNTLVMHFFRGSPRVVDVLWLVACLAVICLAAYVLSVRGRIEAYREIKINSPIQLIVTSVMLTVTIFIDIRVIFMLADMADSGNAMLYYFMLSGICAALTLILEFNVLSKKQITDENKELQKMLGDQRAKYEQEKTNIDMVNLKCHDIRHQLRAMEGRMDAEALRELSDTVNVYSSQVKTGNEAIDVVLARQSLYCLKNNIRLTCLLDGTKLNFIPDHELYALFGNAVENAINAVEKLDAEKRVISIAETSSGGFTNVSVTNFFNGDLKFRDGLPVSDREDHGFGVRSMRLIAEKYGGRLTVGTKDDLFALNMFFPLPAAEKAG